MSDQVLWLAELTVYDPAIAGTRTLRYASGLGHVTGPSETPANAWYDPRIKQPALMKRDLFQSGTTYGRSRVGYGDLVLLNDDGALDGLIDYGFDGRAVTIRRGEPGAAYPAGFTTVLVGTMEQAEFSSSEVRVKLRDRQFELQVPLQPTKYAGDNVLPAGLEGVEDLAGKPKPVLYGTVNNVPAVPVNTAKLIFQVAAVLTGSACNEITAVYDRGIPLTFPLPLAAAGSTSVQMAGVAYGAGIWVAVGSGGAIKTSTDNGATWSSQTSTFGGDHARAVIYAGGQFVMVGDNAKLATSPDGISWTSQTSGFGTDAIRAITYGAGTYVIGGANGKAATSTNATAWTSRTSQFGTTTIRAAAYGNGIFILAGESGKLSSSPTGATWTARTSTFGTTNINAAVFGGEVFSVGGASGTLASSLDGILWHSRSSGTTAAILAGTYSHGAHIMVGFSNEATVSRDGLTWFLVDTGETNPDFNAIAAGNGIVVAMDWTFTRAYTTPAQTTYGSQADLLDDSLAPSYGRFKSYPAGGYFRLGSPPAGLVTADVTQGASAADRTAGQVWAALMTRAGYGGDYSTSDVAALDAANDSVIGYFADSETTYERALDEVAASVGAWWGPDRTGTFRIKQLTAPSGTPAIRLTANDLLKAPERISTLDQGRGLPSYRTTVRYAKNWTVQTDLAGGVDEARRARLAKEWLEVSSADTDVQDAHLLAPETIEDSLLYAVSGASAEAARRQTLRGIRGDRFTLQVPLNDETESLDLGDVIELSHPRFGLENGKLFRVLSVDPDANQRSITLGIWTPSINNHGGVSVALTLAGSGTVT
jgi:hypothetical protein